MASLLTTLLLLSPLLHALPTHPNYLKALCLSQPRLVCTLTPTLGNTATGTLFFTPEPLLINRHPRCRTRITAKIRNLPPGPHAFHIHTYGDLTATDGTSTGGHFLNPQNRPVDHGFSSDRLRHWGDLDNLIAGPDGVAVYNRLDRVLRVRPILGRGVTVHEGEDLGARSQPTGGAGARIAVCSIARANPDTVQ